MILRTSACRDPAFPSAINSIGPCLIGPDSRLYFSCGDLDSRLLAQNAFTSDFAGKMHRIDQDGAIPLDNPFGPEITTWALGLRNPAAFTFDSENGDFWCVDNGNLISDEINRGTPGSNYGWPLIQGLDNTDPEGILTGSLFGLYTQPVVDYGQEQVDPMGIVMIRNGNYGDDIVGNLFVAKSFEQGSVSRWFLGGLIVVRGELFQTALESGTINNMFFGPDGMVYVLTNVHLYRVEPA
jgi:glucose/arabinose dehydrogenase